MKKTTQFRNLIRSNRLEMIMEAHNALSAIIVEEAGFKGIWGSGLSISAALGVRDNNEASWTQVMDVLEFMSDATSIPILLDGDTGYGNFNNARRLVRKLEQRQIAAVCIEDKLFPKTNSFIQGEAQPLADVDEFCGKIKAMKDSQSDDDFTVISRVEAFIAGWGLKEALRRAEAYRQAGTDAILIHSKRADLLEIEAFVREWDGRLPLVVVPTKYYNVPTDRLRELDISLAIWANHNLRASIDAMQKTTRRIYEEESLANVEHMVAPLEEVFRIQGAKELSNAEKKYLPTTIQNTNAIILLRRSGEHPLLGEQMDLMKSCGVKNIRLEGGGYGVESLNGTSSLGSEVAALSTLQDQIRDNTIISCGEIMYKSYVLEELLQDDGDITLIVDADYERKEGHPYLVKASSPYSKSLYAQSAELTGISEVLEDNRCHGAFIGLWKVSGVGSMIVKEAIQDLAKQENFEALTLVDLFNNIRMVYPVSVHYIQGSWMDDAAMKEHSHGGDIT